MVRAKRIWMAALAILALAAFGLSVFMDAADADGTVTIEGVSYSEATGVVSFSGTASGDLVNVVVHGQEGDSQIDGCVVSGGAYSDSFKIGPLKDGLYILIASCNGIEAKKAFLVGDGFVEIESVSYDNQTHIVHYSGSTSYPIVNLRIVNEIYISQINSEVTKADGSFSGSMKVDDLDYGQYTIQVKAGSLLAEKGFKVVSDQIEISSLKFDDMKSHIVIRGYAPEPGLILKVQSPNGIQFDVDITTGEDGLFTALSSLGNLEYGSYTLINQSQMIGGPWIYQFEDPTNDEEVNENGNVTKDTGRTLIRFEGSANRYAIPSTVTRVLAGAFDNCHIDTLVIDRDVSWEITMSSGVYPFERCGVRTVIIEEGVTCIPDYLLSKTLIESIIIPSTVEYIGVKSVYGCSQLEKITFVDGTKVTTIGKYAFSANSSLRVVDFGSSTPGYGCSIGNGAFMYCDNLEQVSLDKSFVLKNIGELSFAKTRSKPNESMRSALSFNTAFGILIPDDVEEIGRLAFSTISKDDLSKESEPVFNTYCGMYVNTAGRQLMAEGWQISFEEGAKIGTINEYAFYGYSGVILVDLSECTNLTLLKTGAFGQVLGNGELKLSDNIVEMYSAFSATSGIVNKIDVIIPLKTRVCQSAFDGIARTVSAKAGSELEFYGINKTGISVTDLSKCDHLSYVHAPETELILKPGAYHGSFNNLAESTPGVSYSSDRHTMIIGENTKVVNWDILDYYEIECNEANPYFKMESGLLFFENDGKKTLLSSMHKSSIVLTDGCYVSSDVLGYETTELYVGNNVLFDEGALSGCKYLEILKLESEDVDVTELIGALKGCNSRPSISVDYRNAESVFEKLSQYGNMFRSIQLGSNSIFVQAYTNNSRIDVSVEKHSVIVSVDSSISYMPVSNSEVLQTDFNRFVVSEAVSDETYLWFIEADDSIRSIDIRVDAAGGVIENNSYLMLTVPEGTAISYLDSLDVCYSLHDLLGWKTNSGLILNKNDKLRDGMTLTAAWSDRNPKITVKQDVGYVYSNGEILDSTIVNTGAALELTYAAPYGFEPLNWIVNGVSIHSALEPLVITNITDDYEISVSYRYYSPSSGLNSISDRGLPTIGEADNLVKVAELGGVLDVSGMIWKGHASVPLVVDNRVYFRAGPHIYGAESDTGYIFAEAESAEADLFYHQLGYGDGVIIDYKTSKVYNLNLEQLFVLDRTVNGVDYYNGLFYTSGDDVYAFSSEDLNKDTSNEIKRLSYIGHIDNTFGSYGFTKSIFVDHYMYRVLANGNGRGIAAMDLNNGAVKTVYLSSIEKMFLDDGWISYNEGYLYLPGYSHGLFNAIATDKDDTLAIVKVDGLEFGQSSSFVFNGQTGWISELVFDHGRAYIVAGSKLYAFEVVNGMLNTNADAVRVAEMTAGHGSIVVDSSHYGEAGNPTYIYGIPYMSSSKKSMVIVEDRNNILSSFTVAGLEGNYNSQTVRADYDGRMIWYNDSGHIFDYTTPDKNAYFFFVNDGTNAMWCDSRGETAIEALANLGSDIVGLDNHLNVTSIFGSIVSSSSLYVLQQEPQISISDSLKRYSWIELTDLYDRGNDLYHYYQILAPNADLSEVGDEFTYLMDGEKATYSFKDNVGDNRSILNIGLTTGEKIVFVKFVDEDGKEIISERRLAVSGQSILGDLPSVSRPDKIAFWKIGDQYIDSLRQIDVLDENITISLEWRDVPNKMLIEVIDVINGTAHILVTCEGSEIPDNIRLMVLTPDSVLGDQILPMNDGSVTTTIDIPKTTKDILIYAICGGSSADVTQNNGFLFVELGGGL